MSRARSPAHQQLELPALDDPRDAGALPEPAAAVACIRCGWYVLMTEETCPVCHVPRDTPR
ncbi:hypothetical protein [Nannocystis pusilla]|uniref:Rubrerythrin-like domain-containing protein n=1 Tax=Nannocystis pusilla TaxID=889268 RepID=A0ABS7TLB7_9BACT|nr:hypothetical protein [Nannocystis pusilla]MBZ5709017.1 hypothetical protein [Nannocystis pusilla]